jgi:hypothetical protein
MERLSVGVVVFAIVAIAGCGSGDSQKIQQARQSVRAWAATVELVDEHAHRGSVPPRYVEQICEAADEALEMQRKQLDQLSADDVERNDVYAELTRTQEKAKAMESAASTGGRRS